MTNCRVVANPNHDRWKSFKHLMYMFKKESSSIVAESKRRRFYESPREELTRKIAESKAEEKNELRLR
jgi:ribosomal protein S21